jgi:hypothetical protein
VLFLIDAQLQKGEVKKLKKQKLVGVVRQLDSSDPRSLDHPSHRDKWLALAGAIGRSLAKKVSAFVHRGEFIPLDRLEIGMLKAQVDAGIEPDQDLARYIDRHVQETAKAE